MLVWLLDEFAPLLEQLDLYGSSGSRVLITARTALASLTSFMMALLLGPIAIRWLKRRFCERIDSASDRLNELHANKNATPTMGGLFIVAAVLISTLLWGDLGSAVVQMGLVTAVGFATIGAFDDWIKLSTPRNGLPAKQKLLAQSILTLGVAVALYRWNIIREVHPELVSPIGRVALPLGLLFIPWGMFVMIGSSNAVNLTDGLDGLAAGCTLFAGTAFIAVTYLAGHAVLAEYLNVPHVRGAGELCILLGALVGAVLGFLWFNGYPAEVFMGDTGSLPIGGLLAYSALVTRQEALLIVIGGVFVLETLSVILQVGCYRTFGQKPLACSPLHNHYLFRGHHEIKITIRFWIVAALLAIIGLTSLRLR